MKKILILFGVLICLIAARSVFAQTTEGIITYDMKINLHRRLPQERQEMKASIPEFRTTKEQLIFNSDESLYKPIIEDEEEESFGGRGVQMRFRQPNTERYLNQITGKIISKQELMVRTT